MTAASSEPRPDRTTTRRVDLGRGVRGAPRLPATEVDRLHVTLRPPHLSDFPAWRGSRMASRESIEAFWPGSDLSWDERHTYRVWVRQVLERRAAARRGELVSWVVDVGGRLRGQVELTAIDRTERSAEIGIWLDTELAGHGVGRAALASVVQHAFAELGLERIVSLVAVGNVATERVVTAVGFRPEAVLRDYLAVGTGPTDHTQSVLLASDDVALRAAERVRRAAPVDVDVAPADDLGPLAADLVSPDLAPGRGRALLEVLRYAASAVRAARAAPPSTPSAPTPSLRAGDVTLDPTGAHEAWHLSVAGRSSGVIALHQHAAYNDSVGLNLPPVAPGSVASDVLAVAVELVVQRAVGHLAVRRTWTRLPDHVAPVVTEALAACGFVHEGDLRLVHGGCEALWARVEGRPAVT